MRKFFIYALILTLMGCVSRNRVGSEGSTGDGGIALPDSTTRYDTSHPRLHSDTSGRLHDSIATPDTERRIKK